MIKNHGFVPEGYVGRYQQNITSDQFLGLCTTKFTSCWPIIIIHKEPISNSPIQVSLIHFDDNSQPPFVKLEIDCITGNNEKDAFTFTADNCHIFIIRQLSFKYLWERQQKKQMLLKMMSTFLNKDRYTIIDLPKEEDQVGFIGIKFADLSNIKNSENLNSLSKYFITLSRTKRDLTIQQNPSFWIRHPKEHHLRCFQEIGQITSELQTTLIFADTNDIPVIFDNSHWINIDNTISYRKLDKFIKQYKSYSSLMLFGEIGHLFDDAFPSMALSQNQNDIDNTHLAVTSIIFYIHLWNNNFNLKELCRERIKDLRKMLKNKQFLPQMNTLYQMKRPFTNKLINDTLNEFSMMVQDNKNELIYYSEKIFNLSIHPCLSFLNNFTMLTQIYSYLHLDGYQTEIKDIEKCCVKYSKTGKEMYIKKDFDKAILYFNKALKYCTIFYVNGDLSLIRAYYNLGASYHNVNDLVNAKKMLLIAQVMCESTKYQNKNVKSLKQKILNRFSEFK